MGKKEKPGKGKETASLEIQLDGISFRLDAALLFHCDGTVLAITGCVALIGYNGDGVPDQVQIRELPGGRVLHDFPINPGLGRVFERAQDHCLRVQIFYCRPRDEDAPNRILRVSTLPDNGSCCPREDEGD